MKYIKEYHSHSSFSDPYSGLYEQVIAMNKHGRRLFVLRVLMWFIIIITALHLLTKFI